MKPFDELEKIWK